MKLNAFKPANAEERESVVVLQASEFALDGGAAAVEAAPFVAAARDAKVALFLALAERNDGGAVPCGVRKVGRGINRGDLQEDRISAPHGYEPARYTAALAVAATIAGWALAQQPVFLRDLSIRQAAAGHDTQVAVVVAALAGGVILFPSLALLFRLTLTGRLGHARPTTDQSAPGRTRPRPRAGASARAAVATLIAGVGFLTVADTDWAHAIGVVCFLAFVAFAYRAVLGGDILDSRET